MKAWATWTQNSMEIPMAITMFTAETAFKLMDQSCHEEVVRLSPVIIVQRRSNHTPP